MAFNPSKAGEPLVAPPASRGNTTNDPGFDNKQGYYPFDLSHTEVLASLFGQGTPSLHLVTAPGDRHVVYDDVKLLLNRIDGNLLNTFNLYQDSFFVSNRTLFPNNWDKLIPNPVIGDDIPHSARPLVPLIYYFQRFWTGTETVNLYSDEIGDNDVSINNARSVFLNLSEEDWNGDPLAAYSASYFLAHFALLPWMVSRGQLLDYLGLQFDKARPTDYLDSLQFAIDQFFLDYSTFCVESKTPLLELSIDPSKDVVDFSKIEYSTDSYYMITEIDQFRERFSTALERGHLLVPLLFSTDYNSYFSALQISTYNLIQALTVAFPATMLYSIENFDKLDEVNATGHLFNISKPLAYQLCMAHYYSNDTVDNIYTSDLYMQLLRGTMFPSVNNSSTEPTFDFNGVPTEYDYISYGAWYKSLFGTSIPGAVNRRYILGTMLFLMRRTLRYGDYFTTGRTRMLAVGQMSVPVSTDEETQTTTVSPVDITLGIVSQRYLNAANRVGSKPISYYASIMGIVPSDLGSIPRYIAHRHIPLENRITTNTADAQGAQTTNLVGYSDNMGFDVFIDDYGIILTIQSFDVLPIYNSGFDSDNFLSDRFEYYNPMMQNIGDQPIKFSEMFGNPHFHNKNFAFTVRNAEYKYKLSKAHGKLCYNMPGYILKFPLTLFDDASEVIAPINPDFIRDKPSMIDGLISHDVGISPGEYFHFIVSVHNAVKSARLMQRAPGILI